MSVPNPSDICVSIRSLRKASSGGERSLERALVLLERIRPDRIEWSYVSDDEEVRALKQHCDVFVAAINTINPPGHACDIEGEPIIAPWKRGFGTPARRKPEMCMNDPEDAAARIDQITDLVERGIATAFQHDDWLGNFQMFSYPSACLCLHCRRKFARYLDLDFDYRDYLNRRGIYFNADLFRQAEEGEVPLWQDFRRFQRFTVIRYLRRIRNAIGRATGAPPVLSVNGLANGPNREFLRGMVEYLNGETWDFSTTNLFDLAKQARELGVVQVSSFFPDVPADQYHSTGFVKRVRRAIAVAYAVGLVPQFPYDVYAGNQPRWFGTWEEYAEPYEFVRLHRQIFDDHEARSLEEKAGTVIVTAENTETGLEIKHVIGPDGAWKVE